MLYFNLKVTPYLKTEQLKQLDISKLTRCVVSIKISFLMFLDCFGQKESSLNLLAEIYCPKLAEIPGKM